MLEDDSEKTVFDYINTSGISPVPIEVLKRAKPIEVVAFSSHRMVAQFRNYDFNLNRESTLIFTGDKDEYPNLQLYCLMRADEEEDVIRECCRTVGKIGWLRNIFETPCPEIAELWQIIKENNLYTIKLARMLTEFGLDDPELVSDVAIFNANFFNQIKSARNV